MIVVCLRTLTPNAYVLCVYDKIGRICKTESIFDRFVVVVLRVLLILFVLFVHSISTGDMLRYEKKTQIKPHFF